MFKCPFCKSEDVIEVIPTLISDTQPHGLSKQELIKHNWELQNSSPFSEFQCNSCGIVSKVNLCVYEKSH